GARVGRAEGPRDAPRGDPRVVGGEEGDLVARGPRVELRADRLRDRARRLRSGVVAHRRGEGDRADEVTGHGALLRWEWGRTDQAAGAWRPPWACPRGAWRSPARTRTAGPAPERAH